MANGCIWVHAVSLGETIAATPLIRALQQRYPHIPLLVTNMTATGLKRTQAAFGDSVISSAVPYDLPGVVRRFLQRANPKMLVVMETELWPNLFAGCRQYRIPVVVTNARLSERSAKGYQRIAPLVREMFQSVSRLLVHAVPDAARFQALGMPASAMQVTGSLKYDLELPTDLPAKGDVLRNLLGRDRPVWVAASTHAGEEEIMLAAHRIIQKQFPNALLICVPRHPERFNDVADKIAEADFAFARRSEKKSLTPADAVYLADSFGEMMLMYAACDVACVAGSFVSVGGHNMIEPAALKKPVVTGPQLFNFAEISEAMQAAGGMVTVTDAAGLADVIVKWFSDPARARDVGEQGFSVVAQNRGALARQLAAVCEVLDKESLVP